MSSTVVIIGGAAIVIYTIGSQLVGTALRAKRMVIIPAVLTVLGVVDLSGHSVHPDGTDIALIAVGSAVAAAIGLTRDGYLWGKSPLTTLWLWAAFFASRGILFGIGHAAHAHVASSTHAELLVLGINRIARRSSSGCAASPWGSRSRRRATAHSRSAGCSGGSAQWRGRRPRRSRARARTDRPRAPTTRGLSRPRRSSGPTGRRSSSPTGRRSSRRRTARLSSRRTGPPHRRRSVSAVGGARPGARAAAAGAGSEPRATAVDVSRQGAVARSNRRAAPSADRIRIATQGEHAVRIDAQVDAVEHALPRG